jgi:hypothetical protein
MAESITLVETRNSNGESSQQAACRSTRRVEEEP